MIVESRPSPEIYLICEFKPVSERLVPIAYASGEGSDETAHFASAQSRQGLHSSHTSRLDVAEGTGQNLGM